MRRKLFLSFSLIFSWLKIGKLKWSDLEDPSALFFFIAKDANYYLHPDEDRWADPTFPPNILGEGAREAFGRLLAILAVAHKQGRGFYADLSAIKLSRNKSAIDLVVDFALSNGVYPEATAVQEVIDDLKPLKLCARTVSGLLEEFLQKNGYDLTIPESYTTSPRGLEYYNIPDLAKLITSSTRGLVQPVWVFHVDRVVPLFP